MRCEYWLDRDFPQDWQELQLVPLSDLHIGDEHFNVDKFIEYRQWILAAPNRVCTLTGDIINNGIKSSVSDTYDEILSPRQQIDLAVRLLMPLAKEGRILFVVDGNHERRSKKDVDISPAELIASKLGAPYRPNVVYMKIRVGKRNNQKPWTYTLFARHGGSGATTEGGVANMLHRMRHEVLANVYLASHKHMALSFPSVIYVPDLYNNRMREHLQVSMCTSSYLEWSGYAQFKGYAPQLTGAPLISLGGNDFWVTGTVGPYIRRAEAV